MKPAATPAAAQPDLFRPFLRDIINPAHPLVKLANAINWAALAEKLNPQFAPVGRDAKPARLMIGLQYLKYTFDLSDAELVTTWVENPYWQYFCGGVFFEHAAPIDPSSMTHWRGYLKEAGVEEMLAETIRTGLREKFIKPTELQRVNVDTTVQEKHIRFPTDSRLLDRSRERLVSAAKSEGITLRQTYCRVGKRALRQQSAYASAKQYKRACKEEKKLRGFLGRVVRDIERKCKSLPLHLKEEVAKAKRLLTQQKTDSHKLYSLHEPQVECIAKGKAHKRYEFGCKAGFVTAAKTNWAVGALAFSGAPYDGHTLAAAIKQTERLIGVKLLQAVCDLGYRGHDYEGACQVEVVKRHRKNLPAALRKWWKRRSAIEPVIGHLKSDNRLVRNRLGGEFGDKLNPILSACGFNLRKLLRRFAFVSRFFAILAVFLRFSGRVFGKIHVEPAGIRPLAYLVAA